MIFEFQTHLIKMSYVEKDPEWYKHFNAIHEPQRIDALITAMQNA